MFFLSNDLAHERAHRGVKNGKFTVIWMIKVFLNKNMKNIGIHQRSWMQNKMLIQVQRNATAFTKAFNKVLKCT